MEQQVQNTPRLEVVLLLTLATNLYKPDQIAFEILGEGKRHHGLNQRMFMNRSAIKLANVDALLDFRLTVQPMTQSNETFGFVDLCGAPGGFSEYIMYRCCQKKNDAT